MSRTQQVRVYAAEDTLLDHGRVFGSIAEVQAYLDDLRDRWWWDNPAVVRVEVYPIKGRKSMAAFHASRNAGLMELAKGGMNLHTVLHELAHITAQAKHGSEAHDPWWARELLVLTYFERGPEAYVELARAFDRHDVIHDPKEAE